MKVDSQFLIQTCSMTSIIEIVGIVRLTPIPFYFPTPMLVSLLCSPSSSFFVSRRSLQKTHQGFTLLELMIVVIITGLLAAISVPSMIANVDKARYASAKTQMSCMGKELKIYQLENGVYPGDRSRNVPYTNAGCYEVHPGYVTDNPAINKTHNTRVPFNSVYDYESWSYGSGCYVAITFFGKNGLRKFDKSYQNDILTPGFHTYDSSDDDLVFLVDITSASCAPDNT